MRVNITLACTECGERNYISKKNKRNNPDRVEFKKYCPRDKNLRYTVKQNKLFNTAEKLELSIKFWLFVFQGGLRNVKAQIRTDIKQSFLT